MADDNDMVLKRYQEFSSDYISFLLKYEGFNYKRLKPEPPPFAGDFTKDISIGLVITHRLLETLFEEKLKNVLEGFTSNSKYFCGYMATFFGNMYKEEIYDWTPLTGGIAFAGDVAIRCAYAKKRICVSWTVQCLACYLESQHDTIMKLGDFQGLELFCRNTVIGPKEPICANTVIGPKEPTPTKVKK